MLGLEHILVILLEVCRLLLMLFACLWGSGLFVLIAAGRNLVRGSTSKHWPTTVGTICDIGMTEQRAAGRITYWPHVRYRYWVDGTAYESSTIQFGGSVLGPPTSAPGVLEKFLAAEAVCVYYHPTQPQLSVLAPGTDVALVELLIGGGLLGGAIGALYLSQVMPPG